MIRTLQDRGVQQGIDVYMECTVTRLLTDSGRVAGAFAYWRETGRLIVFKPSPSSSPPVASARPGASLPTPGNTRATAWLSPTKAGAELMDMEFVQFIPPGWFGRPASRASSSLKQFAGKAASCATKQASASWKNTTPSEWNSPRATSLPAPSTQK